jgi:hypothetical protein
MIAGWRGRLPLYAGRLILLKTCLASVPIYLLSIIKFSRWAIDIINLIWDISFGITLRRSIGII